MWHKLVMTVMARDKRLQITSFWCIREQGHLNTFFLAVWCTSALCFLAMYCQIPQ